MMYNDIFFEILTLMSDQSDQPADVEKELARAYDLLEDYLQKSSNRYTPEEEFRASSHAWNVALRLARWGQNLYAVKASLLHMIAVDEIGKTKVQSIYQIRKKIDPPTADILLQYYTIKKRLLGIEEQLHKGNLNKERLFRGLLPEAFYILIAHRMEELEREVDAPSSEIKELAQTTMDYLLPEIQAQGAYYLADILEELCFKITNRAQYDLITDKVQLMQSMNHYSYEVFRNGMNDLFSSGNKELPMVLREYKKYFHSFHSKPRSLNGMNRFLAGADSNLSLQELALYELTLVLKEPNEETGSYSPTSVFLKFYDDFRKIKQLKPRFTVLGLYPTRDSKTNVFMIIDSSENFYLLYVQTESEYQRYLLGSYYVDSNKELEPTSPQQIKVHKLDGSPVWIQKGATVLDFAFLIHKELGLDFNHARVNDTRVPPHYQLQMGDRVEIVSNFNRPGKTIDPELNWLKYVNTPRAKQALVRHFNNQYTALLQGSSVMIHVSNQDGTSVQIESGATILDYTFQEYGKKALSYKYGYIAKESTPCRIDYRLHSNERVTVEFEEHNTATLDWFKYVNTEKAKDILIAYFKQSSEPSQ